ncbi:MAG TPA: efflux RND transporter permease subunit [Armatimonadota bacterium]|jgi:HAE1 family hydrophobic/amphiphilic exporter-1
MWLTRLAINRRVTIAMVILGIMLMGLVGYTRMPWDQFPKVDFPYIFITMPYPGAGPEEVEQGVVKPVEDQVSIINKVKKVTSTCREGVGTVSIQFEYGTNLDAAASDVRDAVDRARVSFPTDVTDPPQLLKLNISALPVMRIGIVAQRDPRDLYRLVDDKIKPVLGQIPGVASVAVTGGAKREIQIRVDRQRLDAVGLTLSQLSKYLAASNLKLPAGDLKEGLRSYTVRVMGEFAGMDEIRALRLPTPNGGLVRVDSLAQVLDTSVEPETIARIDGQPSVGIAIQKQSDANTVQVCDAARAALEKLTGTEGKPGLLPADVKSIIAEDSSDKVRESIFDVLSALRDGAILASLIVFLFLHNVRATIIVALAIPTSIICTFLPIGMGFAFSLNMMVLLGLALSVGILIDDSIVVLENVQRHLNSGETPTAAAYNGRSEIGAAAVAITMVDVVVFVPIALMGGIVGQFFYAFGLTVATCTLFSLMVSFTLTPSLASWWFVRIDKLASAHGWFQRGVQWFFDGWDHNFSRLERRYRVVLSAAVHHPWITVGVAYTVLIFAFVFIFSNLGGGMFPVSDSGRVAVDVEASPGTRLAQTDRILRIIEQRLSDRQKYPEIVNMTATAGQGSGGAFGGGDAGGQYGYVFLEMSKRHARVSAGQRSDDQLAVQLRQDLADIPGATIRSNTVAGMGGGGAPIQLDLMGDNLDELGRVAQDLARKLAEIPGLRYVDTSSKPGRPEVQLRVNRERLTELGLTLGDVAANLRGAYSGTTETKYRDAGDVYDLRVEASDQDTSKVTDVPDALVGVSPSGQVVRVRDIAAVVMSTGPSRIDRLNRQREVAVTAYNDSDVISISVATTKINALLDKAQMGGVTSSWGGDVEMFQESFRNLFGALALAIILIYMLTAALYNSVLEPFNILFNLPVAMVGAGLGLLICHMQLTIISMIGIIMLIGIVGKNSILVVDYANTLRKRGLPRTEALITAGPHRMKPVLMTSIATIGGMLPTALAVNEGSEFRAPMAVAVIFGLALATGVSLLLVPATYVIWDNLGELAGRLGHRLIGGHKPAAEPPPPPPSGDSTNPGEGLF